MWILTRNLRTVLRYILAYLLVIKKLARVQPIYKSDDRSKCQNYHLISILSAASKIFEKEFLTNL